MASCSEEGLTAAPPQRVFDSHIHLAVDWREGEGGLPNEWLPNQPTAFHRNWTEADMLALSEESGGAFQVVGAVYVECFNRPALEEARWALRMADDPSSVVEAVVAHIPVPDGGAAVRAFLDALRENGEEGKRLPRRLRGGRVVLFGHPPDHCATSQKYAEGLRELRRSGEGRLLWEWCCWPACLPFVADVCERFPDVTFVLDHLGLNQGGDDFETWAPALADLARRCPNVVAKLGAIEEWGLATTEPGAYLDHALATFGLGRVLAESNWFVSSGMGAAYDYTFRQAQAALARAGATPNQVQDVFENNARRTYGV
jgi:predicted TIM-barrel fold metal-dependent hydrolase